MAHVELSTTTRDDGVVILTGELDHASAPTLERLLESLGAPLCLDLSNVAFIDSTGLQVLLRHQQRRGGALHVVEGSRPVQRLFDLAGVTPLLMPFTNGSATTDHDA